MVESGKSIRNEQGVFMMIQSVHMSHSCYPNLHCSSNISYDKIESGHTIYYETEDLVRKNSVQLGNFERENSIVFLSQ